MNQQFRQVSIISIPLFPFPNAQRHACDTQIFALYSVKETDRVALVNKQAMISVQNADVFFSLPLSSQDCKGSDQDYIFKLLSDQPSQTPCMKNGVYVHPSIAKCSTLSNARETESC